MKIKFKIVLHLVLSLVLTWLIAMPNTAFAAGSITVNTFHDEFGGDSNGSCSLREAIEAVNIHNDFGGCTLAGTAPFTIQLQSGTYTLSLAGSGEDFNKSGDLDVLAPLLITGMGKNSTIIQAGMDVDSAVDRVFHILPTAEINVSKLTIQHGSPEENGNGGGIANFGGVTLTDVLVVNNRALGDEPGQGGGGIYGGPNSVTTLNNSKVAMNSATVGLGNGGGILNGPNGILTVNGGKIVDNAAARAGGGVENNAGFATFKNLELSNNTTGINGGGLHISGAGSVAIVDGVSSNNFAGKEGGALWNSVIGTLTVQGTRIMDNVASGDDPDQGGGGIFNDGGTLSTVNALISNNVADGASGSGGGVLATVGSTVSIFGGDISNNSASRAGGAIEIRGTEEMMVHATIDSLRMSGNTTGAAPGNGGALHITGWAHVSVIDSEVTGNNAAAEGGGLWNSAVGTLLVKNVRLENNIASGADADQGGGALFNDGGTMHVANVNIINNVADGASGSGGGILATAGGKLTVMNGRIVGNSANRAGGGIEINGSAEMPVEALISGTTMSSNTTGDAPGNGGALHITGVADVAVSHATIEDNFAAAEGGGLWNSAVGTLMVESVKMANNIASGADADQGGGALFNDGGTMTVANSTIINNIADGEKGSGGGIFANSGSMLTVMNSELSNNSANRAGGAIEIKGTAEAMSSAKLKFVNFYDNRAGAAPGNGGAVHITGQADVLINGGSATGNVASAEGGAFWNSAVGTLTVKNVRLENNVASGADADQGGGALFTDGGAMDVFNIMARANVADGASGSGGGILALPGSTLTVTGGTLLQNMANRAGGAIEIKATMTDTVLATLNGVVMKDNMAGAAPGNGGALHVTGPATVMVNGGIVQMNSASAEGGGLWNSAAGTMMIDGAKIKANVASGDDADKGGGGLYNDGGTMSVTNSIIRGNVASGASGSGGGILNNMGTLSVSDSTIAGNKSSRAGGGIEDNAGVTMDLENVRLLKNSTGAAPGNGGALHISGPGTVNVIDNIVAENSAAAEGGGLWNSAVGTLNVSGTTLNKNMTEGDADGNGGGALYNDGGDLTVSNSTVTGNSAANGDGGGLLNGAGTSTLVNVTIAGNSGSGVANTGDNVILKNSIVAMNDVDCANAVHTDGAPNLDSDGTCDVSTTASPMLGMLANNGGPTATLAPMAGSPVLNAGDSAICADAPVNGVDQRGVARSGDSCNLGAFEGIGAGEMMKRLRVLGSSISDLQQKLFMPVTIK